MFINNEQGVIKSKGVRRILSLELEGGALILVNRVRRGDQNLLITPALARCLNENLVENNSNEAKMFL